MLVNGEVTFIVRLADHHANSVYRDQRKPVWQGDELTVIRGKARWRIDVFPVAIT